MSKRMLKKHWNVFISATAFMMLFIIYLILNYGLQGQAVRAASYSSYMTQLNFRAADLDENRQEPLNEFRSSLDILNSGGRTKLSENTFVDLQSLNTFLVSAKHNLPLIQTSLDEKDIPAVVQGVSELARQVDQELARKVKLVNILQIIVGVFTLLLYSIITLQLFKHFSHSEEIEVKTKQESEGILSTVSEGLFLLRRDYEIGVEQSASLKKMFKRDMDLEGNFFDFVSQYITQRDLDVAKDYVELLFGDRVKEKLVRSLNPLNNVEINIARRDGSFESRYLDFRFNRVLKGGKLKHLLASVTDVTKQVLLEKELLDSKEKQEAQIDLLKSILHIDNTQLKSFFQSTEATLNNINNTLESHNHRLTKSEILEILTDIGQHVHKIKGDAAALGLYQFEFSSHEFENTIESVKSSNEAISGKNLLPLTISLRGMFKDLDDMQTLVNKFSESFGKSVKKNGVRTIDDANDGNFVSKIRQLVNTVSERENTRVKLSFFGFDDLSIPETIEEDLSNIVIQLVRNSIAHGGEKPEQRLIKKKSDFMNLMVSLTKTARGYELIVRDDGKGIDQQAIRSRAIKLGLTKAGESNQVAPSDYLKFLFHPRFSTETKVNLNAGRGVGLPLVRNILLKKGGKFSIKSEKGRYCQFHIIFPTEANTVRKIVNIEESSGIEEPSSTIKAATNKVMS